MDTIAFTKSTTAQYFSSGEGSNENDEYGQKWSLEPSQKDATSPLGIRSADGIGNQSPEESRCTVCGPLKVRLKRQKQPAAPAASTELTLEVVPALGSQLDYYLEDDSKSTPSMVAKSSQTEPNYCDTDAVSNYDSTAPPGSKVSLNGIVWLESASGLLVVRDVIWRGRRYAGALLSEEAAPALGHSKTTRRRGGHPRRRRRGHHDHEHRRGCQPITCNQRPLLAETVSKESSLLTELSRDGSVVYRVPLKRPRTSESVSDDPEKNAQEDKTKKAKPEQAAMKKYNSLVQATQMTPECDKAEEKSDKDETSVKSKAVCAYSDISDDDETAAPITTPFGAPSNALSPLFSSEFDTGLLAAYARFLFEQQQQRLMGMPQ